MDDWEESKRVRSAEALIPDGISIEKIQYIAVNRVDIARSVAMLLAQCSLTNKVPPIIAKPDLFNC
jgi:hypothetical protein